MSRRSSISAALLAAVVLSSSGCAAVRGERVETGMADDRVIDLEPETAQDAPVDELAATADVDTTGQAAGLDGDNGAAEALAQSSSDSTAVSGASTPVAVEDVLLVRSISDVTPEWTTKPEAFNFLAPELFSGANVSGSDLYSSGPVLMTFISPDCAISIDDGPALSEVAERNQSVTFVFVHTDGDAASFEQFVEDADLYHQNVIHINDSDQSLWNRFGIETQPSTLLLDQNGRASVAGGGLGHEGLAIAMGLLDIAS